MLLQKNISVITATLLGKVPIEQSHTLEILWNIISNGSRFVSLNSQFCQDRPTRTRKPDFVVPALLFGAVLAYETSCWREAIQGGKGIKICVSYHAYIQCLLKCILSYYIMMNFHFYVLLSCLGKNNYLHQMGCRFFNSQTI